MEATSSKPTTSSSTPRRDRQKRSRKSDSPRNPQDKDEGQLNKRLDTLGDKYLLDDDDEVVLPNFRVSSVQAPFEEGEIRDSIVNRGTCGRNNGTCSGATQMKNIAKNTDSLRKRGNYTFEVMLHTTRRREELVVRVQTYTNLLIFQRLVKGDQVFLHRRFKLVNEVYAKSTALILRLGFSPVKVVRKTSPVADGLFEIHSKLRIWEKKMADICDMIKDCTSNNESAVAVLHVVKLCNTCKLPITTENEVEDENTNKIKLPAIVCDFENPYLDQINIPEMEEEWKKAKEEAHENLLDVEYMFRRISREYGVTRAPPMSAPMRYCPQDGQDEGPKPNEE